MTKNRTSSLILDGSALRITAMAAVFAAGLSSTALAQQDLSDPADSDTVQEGEQTQSRARPKAVLDEVVVTAQKRPEDVQDIPLSVSAIGAETIKDQNIADLNDAGKLLPNVQIGASPSFTFVSIRGLGSGVNRGFESTVAMIIDDVFYGRPSYFSNGMMDLAGIEVLRGPQGTLYGKNSPAGAVLLRTAQPSFDWGLDADAHYGTHNHIRVRAAGGGPIVDDRLAFRAAFSIDQRDGNLFNTTLDEDAANKDNINTRLKLKYDAPGNWEALLTASYLTVDQTGGPLQLTEIAPRHLAAMQVFDPATSGDPLDARKHENKPSFTDRHAYDVTGIINWDITADTLLTYIGNFAEMSEELEIDADFSPIPMLEGFSGEDYRQISQELRVVGTAGNIDYVAGLYYFHSQIEAYTNASLLLTLPEAALITGVGDANVANAVCTVLGNLPGTDAILAPFGGCSGDALALNNTAAGQLAGQLVKTRDDTIGVGPNESSDIYFDQTSNSYAVFGQGNWRMSPKFALTTGLRFTWEIKQVEMLHTLTNHQTGGDGAFSPANPTGAITFPTIQTTNDPYLVTDERTEFDVSPKLSFQYFPTDDLMAYITIARGFKSGGYNAQSVNADQIEYDGEESLTYELGWRSEFWDNRARFNISAFWNDYEGLQITTHNGLEYIVTNADSARIRGVEMDYVFAAFPFLIFTGNAAYLDAEYVEFVDGPCQVTHEGDPPCDLSGKRLNNAPRWSWVQSVLGFLPIGNFAVVQLGLTAAYTASHPTALDLDPANDRPEQWNFRGQLSLRDMDQRWALSMFVDNITDKRIYLGGTDTPSFERTYSGAASDGRTIAAELRVTF